MAGFIFREIFMMFRSLRATWHLLMHLKVASGHPASTAWLMCYFFLVSSLEGLESCCGIEAVGSADIPMQLLSLQSPGLIVCQHFHMMLLLCPNTQILKLLVSWQL